MDTSIEMRRELRKQFVSIVHYAYPSINTWLHSRLHFVLKTLLPFFQMLFGMKLMSKVSSYLIAPMKTTALTADISERGLGILTTEPLKNGQTIFVFKRGYAEKPVPVKVRWCVKDAGSFYRVGLMFT